MKNVKFGLLSVIMLTLVLMTSGCATTKEVKQLQADVQKASESAANAQSTANAAMKEATAAKEAAQRAEKAANDAKAAAEATNTKLDNMFKKSMQKSG
jgi:outer membrane murein-binding lipoprotein Lpp